MGASSGTLDGGPGLLRADLTLVIVNEDFIPASAKSLSQVTTESLSGSCDQYPHA